METVSEVRAQPQPTCVADEDLALVRASKTGDVAAFEELVKRYDSKLLRIAQSVTRNAEDAEEAVQEAFWHAFQKLGQFREASKFSTWLIRIALNESIMKVRKQRRKAREVSLEGDYLSNGENLPLDLADWAPNPEQRYHLEELREILTKGLGELSQTLRVVFMLRDVEGLSIKETSEILVLKEAAVKARLIRARLQLREFLVRYFRKSDRAAFAGQNETT